MTTGELANVLAASLTAITAVFAAYIAWQQYQLGQRQFRHDLYDRRLKVFQAARSFLSDVARDAETRFPRCVQFLAEASEVEFLFGDDIVHLIQALYQQGIKLALLHEKLYPEAGEPGLPVGPERSQVAQEQADVLRDMMDTLTRLKEAFKPYLAVQ
ncbi:MAG TPA: hypothetical protein VNI83_05250 [Vicinamibacterales bacterium]|nr:hypothetical protein [Vicinamibacterales bacterium]